MKSNIGLSRPRIIVLPKINDAKGNLTFIEEGKHIPFDIKRVYYLYDVPGGGCRGGHSHKDMEQFIIASKGSFDVILDDGCNKKRVHLNRSHYGLYIPPGIWRELDNFSTDSVCLVFASNTFSEDDYIRNYADFINQSVSIYRNQNNTNRSRLFGKNIDLRLVDTDDANYILELRTTHHATKYLSTTENDVKKQVQWIADYKIREQNKKEYYYIIESKKCHKYGALRVYDLLENSFCWGSWIVEPDSPPYVAIESVLLVYEFGFNILGFPKCHFDVRNENKKVLEFHLRFGAQVVGKDDLNTYFNLNKNTFEKTKNKYKKYLGVK
ncbi:MAG: GNAT family N-acetyltransferase [Candidatus Omnitrophota bacterium]